MFDISGKCMVVYLPHNCRMTSYNIYANDIFYISHTAFLTYIIITVHNPDFQNLFMHFCISDMFKVPPFYEKNGRMEPVLV